MGSRKTASSPFLWFGRGTSSLPSEAIFNSTEMLSRGLLVIDLRVIYNKCINEGNFSKTCAVLSAVKLATLHVLVSYNPDKFLCRAVIMESMLIESAPQ